MKNPSSSPQKTERDKVIRVRDLVTDLLTDCPIDRLTNSLIY